jgi:hypothetical protein
MPARSAAKQWKRTPRAIHTISKLNVVAPTHQPLLTEANATSPTANDSFDITTQQQPHAVLTSATQTTTGQSKRAHLRHIAQPVYAVDDFSPTYAAVPFGDGWIIIKL